jgi:CheY-like chemotaxis protein
MPPVPSATILVVEDEAPLRNLLENVLTERGFRVLAAPDGPQAVALAQAEPGKIDLLLTDVRMPGMDGFELHERLREMRGDMKVLFISGYALGRALYHPFLAKPFRPAALVRKVHEVLAGPPQADEVTPPEERSGT